MADVKCWLQSSLMRVFPSSPALSNTTISIVAARNERVSFQACICNSSPNVVRASVSVDGSDELGIQVRRVGYVPIAHHTPSTEESELDGVGQVPGYVPDPLFPEDSVALGPFETHSFWVSVSIPADVNPGARKLGVRFTVEDAVTSELHAEIDVRPFVIEPRRSFPVTHWFYADALCDWYGAEPFDEKFWGIVRPYMENLSAHGNNCFYVPVFTPPTDGVKRPTQLLKVSTPSSGLYSFDFSDVRRWVRLARECRAEHFEWTHFFSQWGVQNALRIYRGNSDRESLLWPPETGATSDVYRGFLKQFLPEFREFLQSEGLVECSFFHVSDEPGGDHIQNYRAARALLKELAPWMKVMDALSDVRYGKEGLTDIPIPSIHSAREYSEAGIPAWAYFCCGPRGAFLNRFVDTPLAKIRMSGWLFYRLNAQGFLHWGYNYWYKSQTQTLLDPFAETAGGAWPNWTYGDTFMVYPGPDGPLDCIRWEVFAESLQDYALLQSAGISPDDPMLAEIRGYDDFPKTHDWVAEARRRILSQ